MQPSFYLRDKGITNKLIQNMEYQVRTTVTKEKYERRRNAWRGGVLSGYGYYAVFPLIMFAFGSLMSDFVSTRAGTFLLGMMLGSGLVQIAWIVWRLSKGLKFFDEQMKLWCGIEMSYGFDDAGVSSSSARGHGMRPWKTVEKLVITGDEWILYAGGEENSAFAYLPLESLEEDLKQFVKRKIVEADGLVMRRR